jgi:phosphopantothenoylcysteine decarboxylase/phosphopantothenate--cysteine ligase
VKQRDLLSGRRILLGVTGSIAAYKAVEILRRLRDRGAEVRVAMTKHAESFVSRLTFEALSGLPVLCDDFSKEEQTAIAHIDITDGLDLALVAPATANMIAKIAAGIADDPLSTALTAIVCPIIIAPAMNDRMYRGKVLQKNIETLKGMGVTFIEPETGTLACGVHGQGRLADSDRIIQELSSLFVTKDLAGSTVLVTAGPTRENLDAVRFISNPSTGKMGYALARAAKERGANVILISGPTHLSAPEGVKVLSVISAREMHAAVMEQAQQCNIILMAAAVSDFTPSQTSDRKIKKEDAPAILQLDRTVDILQELGTSAGSRLLVGFAAETDNIEQNAMRKLKNKNLDLIVVNDLLRNGSGFGTDTNAVTLIDRTGNRTELPTQLKTEVARQIIDAVVRLVKAKNASL